ncbi:hypothetical protein Hypma_003014 [Hypsizygus marmoreus]|uniref:Uncharacterized protein n=1 Tax=Hypsizygus marmoreus TaxID=39966 RepID=A0A369J996_HYPMA|nr:hypothetical protein Hypma_003014 [Hypsizygus marmoreus]
MVLSIAGFHPRSLSVKIFGLGTTFVLLFFLYLYNSPTSFSSILSSGSSRFGFDRQPGTCPPRAYANGRWAGPYYRTTAATMTNKSQALEFSGFEGCASSREFDWHLASDNEGQWNRFPTAQSYQWTVGKQDGCEGLEELDKEKMVRDMVEQGGWLLLGDSITEGHFFSLSCTLYPHVIATPNYTPNSFFDRAWPQNLYLNPASPLLRPSSGSHKQLYLPTGFNISTTPLATFRRIDLLLTQSELVDLHQSLHPVNPANFSLFSEEAVWSISPSEYMPLFIDGGYGTMVVSTGGHWTVTLFGGYGKNMPPAFDGAKEGIDGVIDFFGHAMRSWANEVQSALYEASRLDGGQRKRQVLVRAYLPGHDDCHNPKVTKPWAEIHPTEWASYNWGSIWRYNEVFDDILTTSSTKYPDLHYLAIDRPGRLRPDAHTTGDCLHIMAGAGVLEGWSHYIWHYVSKELGRSRRSRVLGA